MIEWSYDEVRQRFGADANPVVLLVGHSRGAKSAALAATNMVLQDANCIHLEAATGTARPGQQQLDTPVSSHSSNVQMSSRSTDQAHGGTGGPRVAGLVLIDPADASFETVEGPR